MMLGERPKERELGVLSAAHTRTPFQCEYPPGFQPLWMKLLIHDSKYILWQTFQAIIK